MNKTIERVKRANSSVPFLIALLALTLGGLMSFATATTLPAALYQTASSAFTDQSLWSAIQEFMVPTVNALPFSMLAESVLTLVLMVGLWLHYVSSKKNGDAVSTAGLSLVKLVTVIQAIVFVAGLLLTVFLVIMTGLLFMEFFREAGNEGSLYLTLGVIGALLFVVLAVVALYYRGILRTIKSIRMTLATGVIMGKVSGYVIVVNYILALTFLVGALLSPVVPGLISGLLKAIGFIFLSVAMNHLREEMAYIAAKGGESIS